MSKSTRIEQDSQLTVLGLPCPRCGEWMVVSIPQFTRDGSYSNNSLSAVTLRYDCPCGINFDVVSKIRLEVKRK